MGFIPGQAGGGRGKFSRLSDVQPYTATGDKNKQTVQKLFTLSSSLFSQFTSALWGIARFLNSAVWRGVYVQRDGKTSDHLFPFSLASFFFLFFLALKKKNLTKQKFNMENMISMPIYLIILGCEWQQFTNCFMSSWGWQPLEDWRTNCLLS